MELALAQKVRGKKVAGPWQGPAASGTGTAIGIDSSVSVMAMATPIITLIY